MARRRAAAAPTAVPDDYVQVYPTERAFVVGVRHVPQQLPKDEADRLVATGAFTYGPSETEPAPDAGTDEE